MQEFSDHRKTQLMCNKAANEDPYEYFETLAMSILKLTAYFKTLAMCYKWVLTILVGRCSRSL